MIFLALLPFFFIIAISPLRIDINYMRENKIDKFIIKFKLLWNLIKIPINIEKNVEIVSEIKEERKININYLKILYESPLIIKKSLVILKLLKGKIICTDFDLKINFSLSDAAITGLGAGMLWSSVGVIIIIIKDYLNFEGQADLQIFPRFDQKIYSEVFFTINLKIIMFYVLISSIFVFKMLISILFSVLLKRKKKRYFGIKIKEG